MVNNSAPTDVKNKLKGIYKRCRICHSKEKLQFHHLIQVQDHSKGNIVRLCYDCHTKLHQVAEEKVAYGIKKGIENALKMKAAAAPSPITSSPTTTEDNYVGDIIKNLIKEEVKRQLAK
jgi:hypothetical protein